MGEFLNNTKNAFQKYKKAIISVLLVFSVGLLFFIFNSKPVEAYKAFSKDAARGVTVTGVVKSREDILLAPKISANIEKICVKEGDFVKKGQIIAVLQRKEQISLVESASGKMDSAKWQLKNLLTEPRTEEVKTAKLQVEAAQSSVKALNFSMQRTKDDLQDAKIDEERFLKLQKTGAVSKKEIEQKILRRQELENALGEERERIKQAKIALEQSSQNLKLTETKIKTEQLEAQKGQMKVAAGELSASTAKLDDYMIKAPVSGIIIDKILHTGDIASPNAPIARLVASDMLYLSMDIEENQLGIIKKGQEAVAVFDAYPEKTFSTSVKDIVKMVNPLSGTFEGKLYIPKEEKNYPFSVGMTVDTTIILGKYKNIIVVPANFVQKDDQSGETYVFKRNGFLNLFAAKKVLVKVEFFDSQNARIIDGLKNGDILLKALKDEKIKENSRVKIVRYVSS